MAGFEITEISKIFVTKYLRDEKYLICSLRKISKYIFRKVVYTRDVNDAEPRLLFSEKKRAQAEP